MRVLLAAVTGLLVLVSTSSPRADSPAAAYKIVKKIPLGGEGGWDYLTMDSENHRLYITRGTHVTVLDVETGTEVGDITNLKGIHGVALCPKLNRGFITNGGDGMLVVFDTKTLKETDRVKVGARPDAILYDPASNRVFTFNAGTKDATAVDADTLKVAGTVPLGGKPEAGVTDEDGHVYVNVENTSEIVAIDARELKVLNRWPIAPGKDPAGLSIDRKQRRLFSTCHNEKMIVLDADSGKVLATPKIGKGTDASVFDPETKLAFSSNGDGTLTAVQTDGADFPVVANVPTEPGARTMALDTKTHQIYLCTAKPKPGQRRAFEPGSFVILVVGKG